MRAFVLDHESQDATAAIARASGASTVTRPFTGFVDARRFALAQVRTPWTLMIDADERLDPVLRAAIVSAPEDAQGYRVCRTTFYCGKPLRMWRGERLLRLFRTDRARVEAAAVAGGAAQLHERWICDGRVGDLEGTLEHYSYPDAASYRVKYEAYTSMEAAAMRTGIAMAMLQSALVPVRLLNSLLRRGALLDGPAGWTVAWYSALYPAVVQWKALRA